MAVAERVHDYLHPAFAALEVDPAGEGAFWERIARERTPLIEPDPAQPDYSLVTYVFPIPEGARHVVVMAGFDRVTDVMDRIAGTSICHATFRYRNGVRATYSFWPDMPPTTWEEASDAEWKALREALAATPLSDPHHREFFASRTGEGRPDNVASIVSLPDAPDQTIIRPRPDVPRGKVDWHTLRSAVLGNERRIWVYTPPGYDAGDRPNAILLAFDGGASLTLMSIHRILENLLADGRVPPMIAVFVDNPTPASRIGELCCSEPFARFIETELMPWLRERYAVSHNPAEGYVTGVSAGGLAALWVGFRLPHLFGNVISQSASLWWGPGFDLTKASRSQRYTPGWLIDEYERAPKLPLRIWQEVGLMEPEDRMIEPNRRMKAVLEAKGYDLIYSENVGGHDYAVWRGTIGEALRTLASNVRG